MMVTGVFKVFKYNPQIVFILKSVVFKFAAI
jgi:hypothetical protein